MILPININTFEQFSNWIEEALNKKEIENFYDIFNTDYGEILKKHGFDQNFIMNFYHYAQKYIEIPSNLNKISYYDRRLHTFIENTIPPYIV